MTKKVLVVDDSPTMRSMVKLTVEEAGFEVLSAQDGEKALKAIKNTPVELVITDINMPNMNGIELIKEIRAAAETKFTPILVITTEGNDETRNAAKAAGASGWIVKPFQPEVLANAINKLSSN